MPQTISECHCSIDIKGMCVNISAEHPDDRIFHADISHMGYSCDITIAITKELVLDLPKIQTVSIRATWIYGGEKQNDPTYIQTAPLKSG